MRIAIIGSRDYIDLERVRNYVNSLPEDTIIVSGGARGVDSAAESAARARGLQTIIFPADWEAHGKGAGFIRNADIVANADMIVAFWLGKSKGTLDTVQKACRQGKMVIINPDGKGE
jgi:Predicted Rossmann fold nucleotide-binding protein involved in DNA uptake